MIESIVTLGETISLISVSLAFVILTWLALKIRTVRSFEFQVFIFSFVLFVAEVPRILQSLGLIELNSVQTVGLIVHASSMILLSAFLAQRIYSFMKAPMRQIDTKAPLSASRRFSEETLVRVIEMELTNLLGVQAARALMLYLKTGKAFNDPDAYDQSIRALCGAAGGVILSRIAKRLGELVGLEKQSLKSFSECVKIAKHAEIQKLELLNPPVPPA
jgi:hypothetical protein